MPNTEQIENLGVVQIIAQKLNFLVGEGSNSNIDLIFTKNFNASNTIPLFVVFKNAFQNTNRASVAILNANIGTLYDAFTLTDMTDNDKKKQ